MARLKRSKYGSGNGGMGLTPEQFKRVKSVLEPEYVPPHQALGKKPRGGKYREQDERDLMERLSRPVPVRRGR